MPIDASIPLGAKAPDQMQSLSSLVNTANTAQQVQSNGISLNERKAVQDVLSNPQSYTDEQGNIDFTRAMPQIMRVAPTTGAKYVQDLMTAQKQHSDAQQSLNNLTSDIRGRMGQALYSLPPGASPDLVNGTLDQFERLYKGAKPFVDTLRAGYQHAAQSGKADDFIANAAKTTIPQETQQQMNTPTVITLDNGRQSVGVNIKPGVQGMPQGAPVQGTAVQKMLPVGQQDGVTNDSQGNMHVVHKDAFGNVVGTTPLQGAPAAPGAAPAPGPFTLPPGETADTLKMVQGIRANSNQAARTVKDQQFNSNQIIKLADETDTGKGSQLVQNLKGGLATLPWTADSATNYNQLGHYMALQTAQLSQSSGLGGTDAAHSIAAEQAGNKEWTRDAIKSTARVNRALSTGTDLFNRGVENAIQTTGSPFAARDFQNQWSKAATVDALRVYDAYKNRGDDPEGWKQVVKEMGGADSEKFKRTMKQVDSMKALIRGSNG